MRSVPSALVAVVAVLVLTSCRPEEGPVIPDPVPSSELLFESEEEALAAAEEAYGAYLALSDQVGASGGAETELFEAVVGDQMFTELTEAAAQYEELKVHTSGFSSFDSLQLQQLVDDGTGTARIVAYLCLDVTGLRVLNESGADITASDRDSRLPLEVEFSADRADSVLVLERSEAWSGADFCG